MDDVGTYCSGLDSSHAWVALSHASAVGKRLTMSGTWLEPAMEGAAAAAAVVGGAGAGAGLVATLGAGADTRPDAGGETGSKKGSTVTAGAGAEEAGAEVGDDLIASQ